MGIMRATIGIALVSMTASGCMIGGDEPWDNNPGGTDADSDGDGDVDTDSDSDTDTDTGPDSDADSDADSDDDVGLEAATDLFHVVVDGGVDGGADAG